jgi:hypothetical protein
MNKQLLLGFFIAIIACTSTQASMSQAAALQKSVYHLTSSFLMSAGQGISITKLDQQPNQTALETATPTPTPAPEKKNQAPTRTPRPTATPVTIPPSANPNTTTLMILVSLIAVIVVVVGVWLNRSEK